MPGCGTSRRVARGLVEEPEEAAQLGERLAAGVLDRGDRLARALGRGVEEQPRGACLDGHDAQAVRDDVAEVGGDPRSLRGDGGARVPLVFSRQPLCALLELGGARGAAPQGEGDQRDRGSHHHHEDRAAGVDAVIGLGDDDQRGAADRGAGDRLACVVLGADDPERDQQRHEPGRLAAEGVGIDERGADLHGEREHGRGEREPASQQQRQRPQRRGQADGERGAGQVGDPDLHLLDGRERDHQRVERMPPEPRL